MKGTGITKGLLLSVAMLGLCLPQPVLAVGATADQKPVVVDVALTDGGMLLGQVVNPQGAVLTKVPVSVWARGQEIAKTIDVPLGTVKSRLARARGGLRNYLRSHEELLPAQYRLE